MILNNNSTQQINTLLIQLQNRITNSTNEFIKLNNKLNNKIDNKIDNLDSKISDLEKNNDYDVSEMNAKIKANTEAISGKADKSHTHIKSEITDFDHTHDDRYYTESEVDTKLSGKADKIHTHTKSQITDFPTSLKNPNALTINGKTYDGSSAVNAGVQTVANGGTGVTTQADINKAFIGNLDIGTDDVTDGTEFVSSFASDNGFAETAEGGLNKPYKRQFIHVWNYIKGKISSVLGLTKDNYGGKASTAGNADSAATVLDSNNGTPIKVRWGGPAIDSAEWYPAFNADGSVLGPINRANIHAGTADTSNLTTGIKYTDEGVDCITAIQTPSSVNNSPEGWASYIICNHGNGKNYYHQMLRLYFFSDIIQLQRRVNGELQGWKNIAIIENENTWPNRQNFATAKASNKLVIPIGAPSSLEDGCIWIER